MNTHFSISGDDGSVQGAPILSREEVEAFLPDYAFGDITASDKARVEASLGTYPDLAEELRLIQESFEAVQPEFEALDRQQTQRLKNLTVHIHDRLQHEAEKRAHRFRLMKFFVPALAMCVLLAVISVPQAFNTKWSAFSGRAERSEGRGAERDDGLSRTRQPHDAEHQNEGREERHGDARAGAAACE